MKELAREVTLHPVGLVGTLVQEVTLLLGDRSVPPPVVPPPASTSPPTEVPETETSTPNPDIDTKKIFFYGTEIFLNLFVLYSIIQRFSWMQFLGFIKKKRFENISFDLYIYFSVFI